MSGDALIRFKRGTAAAWQSDDTLLAAGEPGMETDTGFLKIGNGSDSWNNLPYYNPPENIVDDSTATTFVLGEDNFNSVTRLTDSGAVEVEIPGEADLGYAVPVGTMYKVRSAGAGGVTFIHPYTTINGTLPALAQHDEVWLRCVAQDEFDVVFHHRESETPS